MILADYQEFCRRFSICRACEHFKDGPVERCALCGCVLIAKARLEGSTCPIGKWSAG